jgi:hypothetical protein
MRFWKRKSGKNIPIDIGQMIISVSVSQNTGYHKQKPISSKNMGGGFVKIFNNFWQA